MKRALSGALGAALLGGCGLIADAVSNAAAVDVAVPAVKDASLSDPEVVAVEQDVMVTAEAPVYTLPATDTSAWGPIIRAHILAIDAGEEALFAYEVTDFVHTGDPIRYDVDVFSRDGLVTGNDTLESTPQTVDACHFDVDDTSTGETVGAAFTACLVDWVRKNGVPNQLEMQVTTGPVLGTRAVANYTAEDHEKLKTKKSTVFGCNAKMAQGISKQVKENLGSVSFSDMSFRGEGCSSGTVFVAGFGNIYDSKGKLASTLGLATVVAASTCVYLEGALPSDKAIGTYPVSGTVHPVFSPAWPGWLKTSITALSGVEADGTGGKGVVCWVASGDAPRTGSIKAEFAAKAHFNASGE